MQTFIVALACGRPANPPGLMHTLHLQRLHHRFLSLTLALLAVAGLTGCGAGGTDFRPMAIGEEGVITVVVDSTRWRGEVGEALRNTLGEYIGTLPAPEPTFVLRPVKLTSSEQLDQLRQYKNIVFVAPLSDTTSEARYLMNVFDEQAQEAIRSGQQAVISRPNLWRRGQQVYYVSGATAADVVAAIETRGVEMRRTFNDITRARTQAEMFEKGRQQALEDTLMNRHGFAVNVQHDYRIAVDTTRFVYLRRLLSDTWRNLYVHYVENADPSQLGPDWIYATQDSLMRQFMQGNVRGYAQIDRRRPLTTENIDFLGRYGFETRGLWHVVERENGELTYEGGMGGPFLTYAFYDEDSRRTYVITGMVFAPGFDKREFLRQLEVIAHTFRTRQDVQRRANVASR